MVMSHSRESNKEMFFNPLSANRTKWSNTLKQFFSCWLTDCLNVFDHFVRLALEGLSREDAQIFLVLHIYNEYIVYIVINIYVLEGYI